MEELYENGHKELKPNSVTYNSVIDPLARSERKMPSSVPKKCCAK